MKKYNGSMMAYLNERTQAAVSAEPADSNEIQRIDFHCLIPNTKNFYGIREVEELAHSMALSGTIEPLLVVKREGEETYDIISGERRFRAISLRYERGELTSPLVPCMVHAPFCSDGKLTAEMRENIAIVCANSYRQKTALEKLEEVNVLEPIARIYYTEALADGSYSGPFRKYFAEQFLGTSSTSLQRLLILRKLCDKAKEALQDGVISDTLAAALAGRDAEEQEDYLKKLANGEVQGIVRELTDFKEEAKTPEIAATNDENIEEETLADRNRKEQISKEQEEPDEEMPAAEDRLLPSDAKDVQNSSVPITSMPSDKEEKEEEEPPFVPSEADWERHGQEKLFDAPIPDNLTPEEAEHEATSWLEECLKNVASMAAERADTARQDGNKRLAAQWEVRKAAVNLVIETIR